MVHHLAYPVKEYQEVMDRIEQRVDTSNLDSLKKFKSGINENYPLEGMTQQGWATLWNIQKQKFVFVEIPDHLIKITAKGTRVIKVRVKRKDGRIQAYWVSEKRIKAKKYKLAE